MNIIRQAAKLIVRSVLPEHLFIVRGWRSSATDQTAVYLTFDDGPDLEHTPAILDQLHELNVPATFFVIGHKAKSHPELIQRIVSEGHDLGNHTWRHAEPDSVSAAEFMAEIEQTDQLLHSITGRHWPLVRPPKGKLSPGKLLGLMRKRRPLALWTLDPRDYQIQHAGELDRWLARTVPTDGDILLLHDNQPWARLLIPQLARWRESRQVQFRRLGDAPGQTIAAPAVSGECPA